jgi:hypothetical protein
MAVKYFIVQAPVLQQSVAKKKKRIMALTPERESRRLQK